METPGSEPAPTDIRAVEYEPARALALDDLEDGMIARVMQRVEQMRRHAKDHPEQPWMFLKEDTDETDEAIAAWSRGLARIAVLTHTSDGAQQLIACPV